MAKKANAINSVKQRFCSLPPMPERAFHANVGPVRARALIDNQAKWVNGTTLNYFFMGGIGSQRAAMKKAFKVWESVGIGIGFREVASPDDSHIRIAFRDDGSWSYVGRTILTISKLEPTMNIGWDISTDLDTGVHEIGHTLGMPHEHQNPFSGIVWDEPKVYASLAAPPNSWSPDTTYHNIIRKIPKSEVKGTAWDTDSIMHYPFQAGLIMQPAKYANGLTPAGGLSALDKKWIRETYPPMSNALSALMPFVSQPLDIPIGGQACFSFKPSETRNYTFKTFGDSDVVLVVSEENAKGQVYVKGIDDSGIDENGEIKTKLTKGTSYTVRLRLLYKEPNSSLAIMAW